MTQDSKNMESTNTGLERGALEEQKRAILARIAKLEERRATAKPEILDKLLAEQKTKLADVERKLAAAPPPPAPTSEPASAPEPVPAPVPAPMLEPAATPEPTPEIAPAPPTPEPERQAAPEPAQTTEPEPESAPTPDPEPVRELPRSWEAKFPSRLDEDVSPKKFPWALVVIGALVLAALAFAYMQFAGEGALPARATPTPVAAVSPSPTPTPTPPPVDHLAKGTELWQSGGPEKTEEALAELRLAADAPTGSSEARARVAEIELIAAARSGGDSAAFAKACEAADGLATEASPPPSAGRARATCEFARKRYGPALAAANALLSASGDVPADAETHLLIGRIHQANRKADKALAAYEKAASIAPRLFEARHLAAEVRAARRDFQGAVEAQTAALAIAPQSEIAAKKLAEYKAALKPGEDADEAVDEDAFTQYYQTAVRLRNEGRTAEAAAQLDLAIALRPNASLLLTKARWVADTDPTGALEAAKRASAAGSDEAWYWIGSLEQRAGRTGNAIAAYEAYLARNPGGSYTGEAQSALAKLKGP